MRLTALLCQKRGCNYPVRAGFRFCGRRDCGEKEEPKEEE
tara:strand:+ start:182 stop:301 length:120 start_codon:yes stop_codon:yes gene_type:complete